MAELPAQVLRYGHDDALPGRVELRAGPLSMTYEQSDLRYVRLGDAEVLRRIYVAVRDATWDTVPAVISGTRMEVRQDSFLITFGAEHRQGPIAFAWKGTIRGSPEGTVEFSMEGVALSTFTTSRIGICVLHPIRECAGRPCTVEHTDGTATRGAFPFFISPHQPFMDIRGVRHEVAGGVTAEVRFSGDAFEMEDQRNWTDESYKTYSRPLSLPRPFEVPEGTRVSQSVTLWLRGRPVRPRPRASGSVLTLGREATAPVPGVGICTARHGRPLEPREAERLRALNLSHLRADVRLYEPQHEAALRRAWTEAEALGAGLEAALFVSDAAEEELKALAELLKVVRPRVPRYLVFHKAETCTSGRWGELARAHLGAYDPAARIGGGTNGNFAELNRRRPPAGAFDAVSFAMSPQVHAFDNASMVEAIQGQRWTIRTARQLAGGARLAVGPVTLRPRGRASQADRRQASLFGAAWTAGSLKQVFEAGVGSATYYETTGDLGVMETAAGPSAAGEARSPSGCVFPVYHVFAEIGAIAGPAGASVVPVRSSCPLAVDGLAVTSEGRTLLVLASFSAENRSVTVRGLSGPLEVRRLDETNARAAMTDPERFRKQKAEAAKAVGGALRLDVPPCGLVFIFSGEK
jgi:hypothetical protein